MTEALEGGEWSAARPGHTLLPGKTPILQEFVWAPGSVWTGGKYRPHRDSITDRPARSQSLYRLSYPVHYSDKQTLFTNFKARLVYFMNVLVHRINIFKRIWNSFIAVDLKLQLLCCSYQTTPAGASDSTICVVGLRTLFACWDFRFKSAGGMDVCLLWLLCVVR